MNATAFVIAAMAAVVGLFAWMVIRGRNETHSEYGKTIADSWGSSLPRLYSADEISRIRRYSDSISLDQGQIIDDITAEDLDLDRVYARTNRTMSAPGDEIYYSWLRHPLTDPEAIADRIRKEEWFASHKAERIEMQYQLLTIGHDKEVSLYRSLRNLSQAEIVGAGKYAVLSVVTAVAFVMLFVMPLVGILALIPLMFLNISVHLRMQAKVGRPIRDMQRLLAMLKVADQVTRMEPEVLREECRNLTNAAETLKPFRRGSRWVTSGGSYGTGMGDVILQYAKLFFHIDLIRYDGMIKSVREHVEEALTVYEELGNIDAIMSAASYITSADVAVRPEFDTGESAIRMRVDGLTHPLLEDPVPSDVDQTSGMLLTGSNASGKSTFLKSVALAALMAQSIGVVAAKRYHAPCYRIMSSMALSDNLKNGESYFVVEIRSLKRIFDAATEDGCPVLAMIDEVLKGTNTVERVAASSQILKELAGKRALIFAATHDVELTYLLDGTYENYHFQETVDGDDVRFDYRLLAGRADARNAIRLLKAQGYPEKVTEAAETLAEAFENTGEWKI